MKNIPSDIRPLSAPAVYRQSTPAVLQPPPVSERTRRLLRKRWMIGLSIAAALHACAILGWWLSPPLRLKAGYAPERWVHVLPVPKPDPPAAPLMEKAAEPVAQKQARPIAKPPVTKEEEH